MSSGGGGNRNRRLEQLQEQTLEDEIKQRQELEADLEARKRLRRLGGRRGQLRFLGPQQRAQERGQVAFTPTRAAAAPAPAPTRAVGGQGSGGRGGDAGSGAGGGGGGDAGSGAGGGGGAGGGTGCFIAGTLVQVALDGSCVPIEQLQLGDQVIAYDRDGDLVQARVISLFQHANRKVRRILTKSTVDRIESDLTCTDAHPFKVPGGPDEFMPAGELERSDLLLDDLGNPVRVEKVEDAGEANVFNIEVGTWNTYIANGVRVHNIDKG